MTSDGRTDRQTDGQTEGHISNSIDPRTLYARGSMTKFLPIMGEFYANFSPMIGAFLRFTAEGAHVAGRTYVANSRVSTPPGSMISSPLLTAMSLSKIGMIFTVSSLHFQ